MRPVAVVIPTALLKDAEAVGKAACEGAGLETHLIISPDPEGTGFTRTVNRGLAQVPDGHDVLLLNDDVEGFPLGWLAQLSEVMYSREDIGIVGPSGDCATAPIMSWDMGDGTGLLSVAHFPFFCALFRRECYDQVGQLDERFIHYASDYIYCDKARYLGWYIVWCRDVVVDHEVNGSARRKAWGGHDLSLYQHLLKRMKREGLWVEARALPS